VRLTVLILLVALTGAGLFGGLLLLSEPDGSALGLELDLLPTWYDSDYRWAGVLLLVGFGVGGAVAATLLFLRERWAWHLVALLGVFLLIWMVVQLAVIGLILPPMQLAFIALGLALLVSGATDIRRERSARGDGA
jgi:peptidoglycan/LPS O-acetylase OafA/YrhL